MGVNERDWKSAETQTSSADRLSCTLSPGSCKRTDALSHAKLFLLFKPPPTLRSDDGPSASNQAVVSVRVGTLTYLSSNDKGTTAGTHKHPSRIFPLLPGASDNFSSSSREDQGVHSELATRGSEFISRGAGVTLPPLPVASRNQLRTLLNWSTVGAVCVCTRRTRMVDQITVSRWPWLRRSEQCPLV